MLALIAGQGRLPVVLAQRLEQAGIRFQLAEMDGFPMQDRQDRPVIRYRLETLGSFLAELRDLGITEICLAGALQRPAIDASKIDAMTLPLVPRIMAAMQRGDDGALREALALFEENGMAIRAAHDIDPGLLPDTGILTSAGPNDTDQHDATRGWQIIHAMGQVDVGQSCVVARGQALAVEAVPGTDWMLRSIGIGLQGPLGPKARALAMSLGETAVLDGAERPEGLPPGGILCKAPKPDQDRRVDLPVIGPETVLRAALAGLKGIVIEAGGVMVLDRKEATALADELGLFLWVRDPS